MVLQTSRNGDSIALFDSKCLCTVALRPHGSEQWQHVGLQGPWAGSSGLPNTPQPLCPLSNALWHSSSQVYGVFAMLSLPAPSLCPAEPQGARGTCLHENTSPGLGTKYDYHSVQDRAHLDARTTCSGDFICS